MINRLFKKIFIFSICIGISIPTNAAVSVSDGSAFVSKAEFSADLNNLSNRMAQLENSLDAKIDSLVSSYLTRNGIWNGAKQDLTYDYYWLSLNNSADLTTKYTFQNGRYAFQGKTGSDYHVTGKCNFKTPSSYSAGTYYRVDLATNIEVINKYNKSGMLVLNVQNGNPYTWSGTFGTDNRDVYLNLPADNRYVAMSGIYVEYLTVKDGTDKLEATITLLQGQVDLSNSLTVHYGLQSSISSLYFFVSKDDKLKCNLYWDWLGFGGGTGFVANQAFIYNVTKNWGPIIYFLDASIY